MSRVNNCSLTYGGRFTNVFNLCYVFRCHYLRSDAGQGSSRIPRSSLIMAKARRYLSSSERGEVMGRAARTAGTAGANDKLALID